MSSDEEKTQRGRGKRDQDMFEDDGDDDSEDSDVSEDDRSEDESEEDDEMDGFIQEDGDVSSEEEMREPERKKARKRRNKRRDRGGTSEMLEGDIDVMREGKANKKKKKLKKNLNANVANEGIVFGVNNEAQETDALGNLFSDEDGDKALEINSDDDDESDTGGVYMNIPEADGLFRGLDDENELAAMFDQREDPLDFNDEPGSDVEDGQDETLSAAQKNDGTKNIFASMLEPQVAIANMVTGADDMIRALDVPERMQVRYARALRLMCATAQDGTLYADEKILEFLAGIDNDEEARWIANNSSIIRTLVDSMRDTTGDIDIVAQISKALEFLHRDHFEVPYIYLYCKDHVQKLILDTLWEVYDRDMEYVHYLAAKRALLDQCKKADLLDIIGPHIESAKDETEIDDAATLLNLHVIRNAEPSKLSGEESSYNAFRRLGFSELVEAIGLSPEAFAGNVDADFQINSPVDSAMAPLTAAGLHKGRGYFDNEADILSAAIDMYAREIASQPMIRRRVRRHYFDNVRLDTTPVASRYLPLEHRYAIVSYLRNKTALSFLGSDRYFLVVGAEAEGYIKSSMTIPSDVEEQYINKLTSLLCSTGTSDVATEWNNVRIRCVECALKKYLYPDFEKEIRKLLQTDAELTETASACSKLSKKLSAYPFKNRFSTQESNPKFNIAGISFVLRDDRCMQTVVTIVSETGTCIDRETFPDLTASSLMNPRVHEDIRRFGTFVHKYAVAACAVSMSCMAAHILERVIHNITTDVPFFGVDPQLPRLFASSKVGEETHPGLTKEYKEALCAARVLIDPLAAYTSVARGLNCGELANLPFLGSRTSFSQEGKERFLERIERVVVNQVSHVGVDIIKATTNNMFENMMQFVPGLGPRKARELISRITNMDIVSRKITIGNALDNVVCQNSIGFIKFDQDEFGEGGMNLLDSTRIHPRDYKIARKVMAMYYKRDKVETEITTRFFREAADCRRENKEIPIESINISNLVRLLNEKKRGAYVCVVEFIVTELKNPFADPRKGDPASITNEDRVAAISGERLTEDCLTMATIGPQTSEGLPPRITLCQGMITAELSSEGESIVRGLCNTSVQCRVRKVEFARYSATISFDVSAKKQQKLLRAREPYLLFLSEVDVTPSRSPTVEARTGCPNSRVVDHPMFKNMTSDQCTAYLKDQPVGEVLFTPDPYDKDKLLLNWRMDEDITVRLQIQEENKQHALWLGKKLVLEGNTYEDLDDVWANFVDPLNNLVECVRNERHYVSGDKDKTDDMLKEKKRENPKTTPIQLSLSHEHKGKILLSYHTSRVRHEYIQLRPGKYVFRQREFEDIEQLIEWFKRHANDASTLPQRHRAASYHEDHYHHHDDHHHHHHSSSSAHTACHRCGQTGHRAEDCPTQYNRGGGAAPSAWGAQPQAGPTPSNDWGRPAVSSWNQPPPPSGAPPSSSWGQPPLPSGAPPASSWSQQPGNTWGSTWNQPPPPSGAPSNSAWR